MDGALRLTHGFLFADLRGYTAFVESRGDAAGARLLRAYRDLVRGVIERFSGAEIRTEGDSFYVVFPSASAAVAAGLAIVEAAAAASATAPDLPMRVGVGVHAGEAEATDEGFVGSAVNVAARLCAIAAPGEVLVSDTVRGLTRTQGDVAYESRGSRRLKGIPEAVAIYRAGPTAGARPGSRVGGFRRPLVRIGALGTIGVGFGVLVGLGALALVAALVLKGGAAPAATSTGSPTAAPTTTAAATIAVRDVPNGDPNTPSTPLTAGRWRLADFYLEPLVDLDGGWSVVEGSSDRGYTAFLLTDRASSRLILLTMGIRPTDVCGANPTANVADVGALLDWLHAQSSLQVGAEVPRTFSHLNATQVEISVQSKNACTLGDPRFVALQPYGGPEGDCCTGYSLTDGHVVRAYITGIGDTVLMAIVDAPTQDEFGILLPKAEAVLDSLAFPSP